MKKIAIPLILLVFHGLGNFAAAPATTPSRPAIYDRSADGAKQIEEALKAAKAGGKRVLLQFGANWCGWCHKLHALFKDNAEVAQALHENYVVVLVDVDQVDGKPHNALVNERYGKPTQYGLPVLVVLDSDGKQLTIQDTGKLEEGDHHDPKKVLAFLEQWKPSSAAGASSGATLPPVPAGKQWTLIWSDEFDGARLDESKWNRLGDSKRRDGFWIKDDAYLSGHGTLLLRTRKDGERYTCGAVNTQGKFEHAFGYYVARCKMPRQPGHWPAFWMMCSGVGKIGDGGRDGTEIDIVEIPWRDGQITMNLHWDGYGKEHQSAGTKTSIPALTEGFHDYGLLWTRAQYVFYVDGKEVWSSTAGGVSQVPEYLKLTEEIGKWGGDIGKAELPDYFEVDYVRVYELSE